MVLAVRDICEGNTPENRNYNIRFTIATRLCNVEIGRESMLFMHISS